MSFAAASSNGVRHTEHRCPRDFWRRHLVHTTLPSLRGNQRIEEALRPSLVPHAQDEQPGQIQPSLRCCKKGGLQVILGCVLEEIRPLC